MQALFVVRPSAPGTYAPGTCALLSAQTAGGAVAETEPGAREQLCPQLQTEDECSSTKSLTSRFTAIHVIRSISKLKNVTLNHWGISGAFMTADIDTELDQRFCTV